MDFTNLIEQQYTEAFEKFPDLRPPLFDKQGCKIEGVLAVIDSNGYRWGEYEICIAIPVAFPKSLPILIEKSRKIERNINWHINEHGICCVGTPARQHFELSNNASLLNWLEKFAMPYLANHIHRKETGYYANGELSHGVKGLVEDYSDLLNVKSGEELIAHLKLIVGQKVLSKNNDCFCGSGKKYKRCFLLNPTQHRLGIPLEIVLDDLRKIKEFIL